MHQTASYRFLRVAGTFSILQLISQITYDRNCRYTAQRHITRSFENPKKCFIFWQYLIMRARWIKPNNRIVPCVVIWT